MRRVLRLCRVAFSSLGRRLPFRVVTPATLFHVWGARQWPSRIATRLSGPALGGSDRWGIGASAVVRAETQRERPLGSTASVRSVLRPDCADGVKSGCSRGTAERLQVDAHTHRVGVGARGGLAHLPRSRPPGCSSRVAGQWLRRGSCLSATGLGPRGTPTKEPPQTEESRSPAGCLFSASVPGGLTARSCNENGKPRSRSFPNPGVRAAHVKEQDPGEIEMHSSRRSGQLTRPPNLRRGRPGSGSSTGPSSGWCRRA